MELSTTSHLKVPEGRAGVLVGDGRKNWTHPSIHVMSAPCAHLSQPSPGRATQGEGWGQCLVTHLRDPGAQATLEGSRPRPPQHRCVTSPSEEISVY